MPGLAHVRMASWLGAIGCLAGGAACAAGLRVATFNVGLGLGAPGTAGHDAARAVLARIDADVVALQEIQPDDLGGSPAPLASFAAALGYPFTHVPPPTSLDPWSRNAVLSRHPISAVTNVGSPAGANDVARLHPVVTIDVPGTANDPLVAGVHLKCCLESADPLRRAVELRRLLDHLAGCGAAGTGNWIVLGDFNLVGSDRWVESLPDGLPSTFVLGADITFPVRYHTDPAAYFTSLPLVRLPSFQQDGVTTATRGTSSVLDHLLASPALAARPHATEIYNSTLDAACPGLPKTGEPLPAATSAAASDHFPVFGDFELDDPEVPPAERQLVALGLPVVEHFHGFDGTAPPAAWSTTGGSWLGADDGSSPAPGNYAYGGADPALGVVPGATPFCAGLRFRNQTGTTITALQVAADAGQWRAVHGGSADSWAAEMIVGSGALPLPGLAFTAATDLPDGPIPGGTVTPRAEVVTGLSIPPGAAFELRFTAAAGPVADVFVNELHYDNADVDCGEFLELVVGPGFTRPLADLAVVLYNGAPASLAPYATHPLDSFTPGYVTPTCHRILYQELPGNGIQNGSPDGIALVDRGTVVRFLSYEGAFTAASGPAAGMTSTDLGVAQPGTDPPGTRSLGLAGTGGRASDFAWARSEGAFTMGFPNEGQTFAASPAAAQGISLDKLAVTPLLDTDRDGLPDAIDPDDDDDGLTDDQETLLLTNPWSADTDANGTADGDEDADGDGQSNLAELRVTLTDPRNPNSAFRTTLRRAPDGTLTLAFPTLAGRTYRIQRSHDLAAWLELANAPGTGAAFEAPLPPDPDAPRAFLRVLVTLP